MNDPFHFHYFLKLGQYFNQNPLQFLFIYIEAEITKIFAVFLHCFNLGLFEEEKFFFLKMNSN